MHAAFLKARTSHFEWGFSHSGLSALAAIAEGKAHAPASSNILVSLGKSGANLLFQFIRESSFARTIKNSGANGRIRGSWIRIRR